MALPTASDNVFPKLIVSEGSSPGSAASGQQKLYIDSADHKLKRINSSGTITVIDPASVPGAELDYVEITSPVNVTATAEGSATSVVTGNAVTYDGSTAVYIEFECVALRPDLSGNAIVKLCLFEDGSSLGTIATVAQPATTSPTVGVRAPVHRRVKKTPSNASHTYSIRGFTNTGTAVVDAGAAGSGNLWPAYIRISRV